MQRRSPAEIAPYRSRSSRREHFRVEPYLARQVDTLPDDSGLCAHGLVFRWYY